MTATAFPFTGVVGNDLVKKGLLAALVSPNITGVLIRGGTGTAKTTLVRSMDGLVPGVGILNLPMNSTEEQLTGGMDLEAVLTEGRARQYQGLLDRASGQILYIDEVNLLSQKMLHLVTQCHSPDGPDDRTQSGPSFTLIGTMDPDEGELSAHMMDRFDIVVDLPCVTDPEMRKEILRRGLEYALEPSKLCDRFTDDEDRLREKVTEARDLLQYVDLPMGHMDTIAQLLRDLGVEGSRGGIAMARTSTALAALDGRECVTVDDIKTAASLCLAHRRGAPRDNDVQKGPTERGEQETGTEDRPDTGTEEIGGEALRPSAPDRVLPIGVGPELALPFERSRRPSRRRGYKDGKREQVVSDGVRGRYVSSRVPSGRPRDLAFDATLRAAAPFQCTRARNDVAVAIEPSDLREKVRVNRRGSTVLFLVDASGSMGVKERMAMVKGTVLTMLTDAYRKRDSVGLVIFHRDSADVLLPPTKSVNGAYRKLKEIPTGGRTPLALGLKKANDVLSALPAKGADPSLVIISDGRANVPVTGGDPFAEALDIARGISMTPVRTLVVDTGTGMPRIDRGERLARALGGSYLRLEDMDGSQLARTIRATSSG